MDRPIAIDDQVQVDQEPIAIPVAPATAIEQYRAHASPVTSASRVGHGHDLRRGWSRQLRRDDGAKCLAYSVAHDRSLT
jgi:hypothetical protein